MYYFVKSGKTLIKMDTGQPLFTPHFCLTRALDSYSTVTDLARLRGWSTSVPLTKATW